tara:strand:- start:6 stop:458 length:453 start_codon:yes stop_codon:yes gene_type:complete
MALIMQSLRLPKTPLRVLSLLGLAIFFIVIGCDHFIRPNFYVGIMPPYLPAHLELVYLSGLLEILGGVAVLIGALRRLAGVGLMVLLVAVYPANVHMAMHPELFPELDLGALYARLALQFVFLYWVYASTLATPRVAQSATEIADRLSVD